MDNDNATFVDHQPSQLRLPRGSSSLPKDVVDREQRRRLIQGIATAVSQKGYAAVTVADITRIAGVSRATFYALFKDKEDCFLYGLQKLANAQMEYSIEEFCSLFSPCSLNRSGAHSGRRDRVSVTKMWTDLWSDQ